MPLNEIQKEEKMRKNKKLVFVVASLFLATLWGCGSNLESGGDQTGPGAVAAEKLGSSTCKVCHTAIAVGEHFDASVHDTDAVGCEGCHGGGQFHKGVGPIPVASPGVPQCTATCHTLTPSTSPVQISAFHNDDPATPTKIEGVIVKTADINGCQVCHYSDHNPVLAINHEWSKSGHGGELETGPVTSATADAWVHYNWDSTFKADGTSDRGACQRCHTATGISNFLTNPAGYAANGSGNDFSHLADWSATGGSGQQEVLYCWGCHTDVSEATPGYPNLRNPGAITETYTATTTGAPATTVVYPNVGPSNVCLGCHLGREIGQNIANDTDADGVRGFVNSHYLTAGGTVFNKSGYEYAGQTYANFGFHKNIGVGTPASNFNTGSNGPCVTCHMSVDKGHTFSFVTKDADGVIERNNSPICGYCHAGMDAGTLEATKENFNTALEELRLALEAKGMFFQKLRNPYFFVGAGSTAAAFTDWNSVATTLGVGLATDPTGTGWKNVMGAAFNYNLFVHDPGAYAHNSDYALKLVANSIDFLTDGIIDGDPSFAATLIGQGMNIASGAGYSPIHGDPAVNFVGGPVAIARANPTTSQATCSVCHPAAPHYGGYAALAADGITRVTDTAKPQWQNNQATCADCHANSDPSLNQPILTQYADSGHGNVTGIWIHEEAGGTCSRCHTTTGFINNLTAGTSFSYAGNDPLQTLNCNACHTSVTPGILNATRRVAGAFTATWSQNSVTASVVFPNAGDSNICIRCHSARRAGANITPLATTTAHYIPAAAVLFGGTPALVTVTANTVAAPNKLPAVGATFTGGGYEFAGQIYAGLGTHKTIALLPVLPATVATGPCVACHMSGTAGHTWNAVTKNEVTGEITAINSVTCSAVACHDGVALPALTPAVLNARKADLDTLLGVLETQLNARSIFFNPANGSFYKEATFTTTVNNAYYATQAALAPAVSTQDLQGAAFNLWLFKFRAGDTAGYVHNPLYARKLITDSADLLNDGVINGN
jgi:hypothetical protein